MRLTSTALVAHKTPLLSLSFVFVSFITPITLYGCAHSIYFVQKGRYSVLDKC